MFYLNLSPSQGRRQKNFHGEDNGKKTENSKKRPKIAKDRKIAKKTKNSTIKPRGGQRKKDRKKAKKDRKITQHILKPLNLCCRSKSIVMLQARETVKLVIKMSRFLTWEE